MYTQGIVIMLSLDLNQRLDATIMNIIFVPKKSLFNININGNFIIVITELGGGQTVWEQPCVCVIE